MQDCVCKMKIHLKYIDSSSLDLCFVICVLLYKNELIKYKQMIYSMNKR